MRLIPQLDTVELPTLLLLRLTLLELPTPPLIPPLWLEDLDLKSYNFCKLDTKVESITDLIRNYFTWL
jgi:hypothetical protein